MSTVSALTCLELTFNCSTYISLLHQHTELGFKKKQFSGDLFRFFLLVGEIATKFSILDSCIKFAFMH